MPKQIVYSYLQVLALVLADASKRTGVSQELLKGSIGEEGAWVKHRNNFILEELPPVLAPGTEVKTTAAKVDDWTKKAAASRRWGVKGNIVTHHDGHGLCYEVKHLDGTVGYYDPTEFEVIPPKT